MVLRRLRKISGPEKAAILEELKNLLHAHEGIVFALLYGSMVAPTVP
jgi:hypothetical protein